MTVASRIALDAIESEANPHLGPVSRSHGFLPTDPPATRLPPALSAWDEAAAALPRMWRDRIARRELEELPLLDASPDVLPDTSLWRASAVLGGLAYAYARCDIEDLHRPAPVAMPPPIAVPWKQVAARMGRPAPHFAYDDLMTHNWRLRDPERADPFRIDNLDLLVPQLGNGTERSFFLINVEMIGQCAPFVEAAVRAQEAVVAGDGAGVSEQLLVMLERLRHVTEVSFPKIDPVPLAPEHADPTIWAKLVAPTGIPIVADGPGVSGAGAAALQLVDAFLGRTSYASHLGVEGRHVRDWYAPNVRRFFDAIEQVSTREFVHASGDPQLEGLFQSVVDAYAGDRGYLGVHRRKVYGFIQVAFKVGRPATASGIAGAFRDKAWRQTTTHLEDAREERYVELSHQPVVARLAGRTLAGEGSTGPVQRVRFDVHATGLTYRPGDRLAVLPRNDPALVGRTLGALGATGDEQVAVTNAWRMELRRRAGTEVGDRLPLGDLLAHATLRPLSRDLGKALVALSDATELRAVLEARREDQWDIPDAFQAMSTAGYDTRRLWRAELWDDECLARLLPPAPSRLYSVSGAPDAAPFPSEVALTVGRLAFRSDGAGGQTTARDGTASTLLADQLDVGEGVPVELVRPLRFRLPEDPRRPIVMFAAGTGIAPFVGFLEARIAEPRAGPNWLLVSVRTRAQVPYVDRLSGWAQAGHLELRLALSRETDGDVPPQRIDALMQAPDTAPALWELLRSRGDDGAVFYVCGQGGFASTVLAALEGIARDHLDGTPQQRAGEATRLIRQLVVDRRVMLDTFTTFAPAGELGRGERLIDTSELVLHNDEEHGWWTALDGIVYDVTEFRHLHPGGHRIVDDNAALDATDEYRAVGHHRDPEIEAMRAMYRIGLTRRLVLDGPWGVAVLGGRVRYAPLSELYRHWVAQLFVVVELQDALRNDLAVLEARLTSAEQAGDLTALKLGLFFDAQSRVLGEYLTAAIGPDLENLWALTAGLTAPAVDANALRRVLRGVVGDGQPRTAELRRTLRRLIDADVEPARLRPTVEALVAADEALLAGLKEHLRRGLEVFERFEAATATHGGLDLLDALRAMPATVEAYLDRTRDILDAATETARV